MAEAVLPFRRFTRIGTVVTAIDETNLSDAAVLFAEQVHGPFRQGVHGKRGNLFGKVTERGDVHAVVASRTVEHARFGKFLDFVNDFHTGLLIGLRRQERLERKEAAQRGIVFRMHAHHQRIV